MPRNGSGTYSLPAGNPVVAGTTIEASWANVTLNDVATEMTGSLSRAGSGGMTGPLRLDAGTASVPALAWSTETTTGLYRAGTNDVRLAVATSDVMRWQAAGVSVTGTLGVSAAATFSTTLAVTGAATLSSTLAVTGTTTLTGAATLTANPTLSAGTANGVLYLNGSQVVTSGTALVFDASGNLGIGTASPLGRLHLRMATDVNALFRDAASVGLSSGTLIDNFDNTFGVANPLYLRASQFIYGTDSGGSFTERMRLDASGNLGLNTTTFGTSAAGVLSLGTGTAPSTGPADTVQLFSVDRTAGNTIPAVRCEGSGVTNAGITSTTVTHKIAMQVNGTIYYLLATTNAT